MLMLFLDFALSRAAPGPNVLIVRLIGWKVAGIPGTLHATRLNPLWILAAGGVAGSLLFT